ncbi:hypothetical protein, partial [Escherichia coli]|uniref:hypothetical protein n=1 Tax=Escherichia coli TaxID=562 RepID=UPI00193365D3
DGTTRVSARVVVVVARETAQDIEGVRVALSDVAAGGAHGVDDGSDTTTLDDHEDEERPRVVAGVAGRSTAVEITLAADYG